MIILILLVPIWNIQSKTFKNMAKRIIVLISDDTRTNESLSELKMALFSHSYLVGIVKKKFNSKL